MSRYRGLLPPHVQTCARLCGDETKIHVEQNTNNNRWCGFLTTAHHRHDRPHHVRQSRSRPVRAIIDPVTHSSRINPTRTPGRASRLRLALRKPSLMHASRSSPAAAASARTDPPGPKTAAFLERHHHTTSCYHTPILYQLYHTPILYLTNALHRGHTHTLPLPSVQRAAEHAARHISRSVSQRCLQQTSIFRRPWGHCVTHCTANKPE